ncbi:MAG: translation initiation factor IF-2 [Planctomycetes bacterium]|nr:translation initiation factor IF-2 [Planctomycetota bacterium]
MRIYELAKELGKDPTEVRLAAQAIGSVVKTNFASIETEMVQAVRDQFLKPAPKAEEPKPAPKKEEAKVEAAPVAPAEPRKEEPAKPAASPYGLVYRPPKTETKISIPTRKEESKPAEEKAEPRKPAAKVMAPPAISKPAPPAPKPVVKLVRPDTKEVVITKASTPGEGTHSIAELETETEAFRIMRPTEVSEYEKAAEEEARKKKLGLNKPAPATGPVRGGRPGQRPGARPMGRPGGGRSTPLRVLETETGRPIPKPAPPPVIPAADRQIEVQVPISVKDFSALLGIKASLLIQKLLGHGKLVTINHALDSDDAELMALEFNRNVVVQKARSQEEKHFDDVAEAPDKPEDLKPRSPVVTIMGHVDHGKTSLLDRIRSANVAAGESGGITQHIGAYKVATPQGAVVFLDTPGHEAFTAMRARGANVTDVVVIVVAADDGVMPQTEEALAHAKAAGATIIVAMNKMDKPGANPMKIMQQISGANPELTPEEWGGKTYYAKVSAITGDGVADLLERLALETQIMELKANPARPASGAVLEARMMEGRGVTATLLVQNGTLHKGDVLLAGRAYGRVRNMYDDHGTPIEEAPPATPIMVTGLSVVPDAGDRFHTFADLAKARSIAEEREEKVRETAILERRHIKMENLFQSIEAGKLREVRIVLKTDVKGSVEVLRESLQSISTGEVVLRIIHSGVGNINESDVVLADASDAIVLGFHVSAEERARAIAAEKGVQIKLYEVIYHIVEEMKLALEGLLEPAKVEVVMGHAGVKQVFKISRSGNIAGCVVTDGKIERAALIRVKRDGKVVHEGKLESLKRFKDDVKEVAEGFECGIKVANFDTVNAGDVIEAYKIEEIARKLERKADRS